MGEDTQTLEEVVVTALGIKREQKALSYNVQQVKGDELTTVKDANFMNSLAGKVAGVQINSGATGAGGAARVVMRGSKSITKDNNALYVIDGIPMFNVSFGESEGQFATQAGSDGVADINIKELLEYHRLHGKMATLTAAQPGGRFGILDIENDGTITNFREKKKEDGGWINAGFMVLEPSIMDLIEGDDTVFEKYPLAEAARMGQLNAYRHKGFWQCMDTLREKNLLESLWQSGNAPWKIWE